MPTASLLHRVHGLIDRTYDLGTANLDPAPFVIGDSGLRAAYSGRTAVGRELAPGPTAMLLLRAVDGEQRACIYYPDRMIANLERNDPERGLSSENVRDFAAFVEELDHLLVVSARVRTGREVRALELEVHANVTKVLIVSLFLARMLRVDRLDRSQRDGIRQELLERGDYASEEPALRERYRTARRLALGFLGRFDEVPRHERIALLRRFSRTPVP